MENINTYIYEKLNKIGLHSNEKSLNFTDEELIKDYNKVFNATTKKEKQEVANKYGCPILRIHDIQVEIAKLLRDNRHNKKEYNKDDVYNFFKLDMPSRKMLEYLDEEPIEFVEYLYDFYDNKTKNKRKLNPHFLSISDRNSISLYNTFKKYLNNK